MRTIKVEILFLLIIWGIFAFWPFFGKTNLEVLTKKVMKACIGRDYSSGCYDKEIPKLLESGLVTMEEAFKVTAKIQSKDKNYLYCHVLGHNLADIETKKDTSKWLDVVARCPALACNGGCPHGAIMRKFKGNDALTDNEVESILPDLNTTCEARGKWNPTDVEKYMCYHSLGHLAMYITGADIDRSLRICKIVGIREGANYYQTCVQGVFMIIFQGIDSSDFELVEAIKPKKEDVPKFCSNYSGLEFTACRTEAWFLYIDEFKDPNEVVKFCSFTNGGYGTQWCYETTLGLVPLNILRDNDVDAVAEYCFKMPGDKREPCFAIVAADWVQDEPGYVEESVSLCKIAETHGISRMCYHNLLFFSKWSFKKDSHEWIKYCGFFPDSQKNMCLSGDVPDSYYGWAK